MRGRCFDVEGNHWKTVTPLTATSVQVSFQGFNGYTGSLRECGWDFSIVENHFTKRKKLIMRNSALHLVGSGDYEEGFIVFIRHMSSEKVYGQERVKIRGQTINIDQLEIVDLLDAIARRQQAEMPVKPKPQAQVIELNRYA